MQSPIQLSLLAGLSLAGIGSAAAESDPGVWRWYVTNALSAQQDGAPFAPILREGRAGAIDGDDRFRQRYERYFADGSPAPAGDAALR
jgi:hypothetical protein